MAYRTCSLIYHDVVRREERDTAGFRGPVAGRYKLDPELFSAHLGALAAAGVDVGLYEDRPQAMLTFDDGGASAPWVAGELERHGWRGLFFVVTERIGTPGFIDADALRELVGRGHAVGSHTHTHPSYFARLDGPAIAQEWLTSRELLSELISSPPITAAVPGGSISGMVIEQAARAGYERLFTSTPRARVSHTAGITVLGRYTMWASDPPELAAALVRGAAAPRLRRWLGWQVKSAAKRVNRRAYEAGRSALAEGRSAASRNDSRRAV